MDCADPAPMLDFLLCRISARKLLLYAVACCERIKGLLADARSRSAVAALRRFADGRADRAELEREVRDARTASNSAWRGAVVQAVGEEVYHRLAREWRIIHTGPPGPLTQLIDSIADMDVATNAARAAQDAASCALSPDMHHCGIVQHAAECAARAVAHASHPEAGHAERLAQCHLLRDIVGNPLRAWAANPSWLAWEHGLIPVMARTIYERYRFDDLPVLADALEDAGCIDEEILAHCRHPSAHVRGCWLLDALLEKR
jgi:hypothetical protein